MQNERYEILTVSEDYQEFRFISEGPRGSINKIVQYKTTAYTNVFNLAFGDLLPDGGLDDLTRSDNKDRDKILVTVAGTVYEFTERFPERVVLFSGSTYPRTRLYKMALSNYLPELKKDFDIYGFPDGIIDQAPEKFCKRKEYQEFLISKKKHYETGKKTERSSSIGYQSDCRPFIE